MEVLDDAAKFVRHSRFPQHARVQLNQGETAAHKSVKARLDKDLVGKLQIKHNANHKKREHIQRAYNRPNEFLPPSFPTIYNAGQEMFSSLMEMVNNDQYRNLVKVEWR